MRSRSFAAAALLALAVAVPSLPAVSASAAPGAQTVATAEVKAKKAKSVKAGKKAKKAKKVNLKFNLGGTLTAVNAEAGTITFTVHGGKDKALRKTSLTVSLGENARVLRNDAPATLADFVEGDRVRAKGTKVDGVYVAKRVHAVSPDLDDDAPEAPAPEAPAPEAPAPEVPEVPETPETPSV